VDIIRSFYKIIESCSMKLFSFFFLILILGISTSFGQLPKRKWFPQKSYHAPRLYVAFQAMAGLRQYVISPAAFTEFYAISPDGTVLETPIVMGTVVPACFRAFNTNLSAEVGLSRGIFAEARFDVIVGQPLTFAAETGIGWNFETVFYENERLLTIRPAIDVAWLHNRTNVGTHSHTKALLLNDHYFERPGSIAFSIIDNIFGIKPRIGVSTPLNTRWFFRFEAGYFITLSHKSILEISQKNDTYENKYRVSPDAPVGFAINGISREKTPFNYNGYFVTAGIAYEIGDRRGKGRKYKNIRY
jgi:hypothetical protein